MPHLLVKMLGYDPRTPAPNANAMPACYHLLGFVTTLNERIPSAFPFIGPVRHFPDSTFLKPLRLLPNKHTNPTSHQTYMIAPTDFRLHHYLLTTTWRTGVQGGLHRMPYDI